MDKKRILLVEDDHLTLRDYQRLLGVHYVTPAHNIPVAVHILEGHGESYDLVVASIAQEGLELASTVRERKLLRTDVPIVLMYEDDEELTDRVTKEIEALSLVLTRKRFSDVFNRVTELLRT